MSVATSLTTQQAAGLVLGAFLLLWFLPSVVVAFTAEREGFKPFAVFVVAFVIGWPFVLLAVVLFGGKGPLATALRAGDVQGAGARATTTRFLRQEAPE
jgi:hypothetical protein